MNSDATKFIKRLKYDYLNSVRQDGGTSDGFYEYGFDYFDRHEEEAQDLLRGLFGKAMQGGWQQPVGKISATTDMMLNDEPVPSEITVTAFDYEKNKEVKRKKLCAYASVADFRQHCVLSQRNANAAVLSAESEWNKYEELLKRSRGDESMLILDLVDGMENAA